MAQTTRITCPADETEQIVASIADLPGMLSLAVFPGAARRPEGDVIIADTTNEAHIAITRILARTIRRRPAVAASITDLMTLISMRGGKQIRRESSEVGWEEMDSTLGRDSTMTRNTILLMAFAGYISASGLAFGTIYLVIAASIIAPAFEPLSRLALALISRSSVWRYVLYDIGVGYAALIAGAALATGAQALLTAGPLVGPGWYNSSAEMVAYWSTLEASMFVSSIMAGLAGAILVASHRDVLTAGVLVAISLVPSLALVPLALAAGEPGVAGRAALRWLADLGIVTVTSLVVYGWKQFHIHRRAMIG